MNRQKALMKKYLSRPENRFCADCKRPSPTWASLNIGVFVCIKCSGCHREIGVHITKIKSVELDLWPSNVLTDFARINNDIANAYWEYDLKNFDFQKIRDNELRLIEFIRDKYEFKKWAKPRVPDPMSLVLQGRDLVKEFSMNGEVVKMYEKSAEPELEKRSRYFNRNKNEKKGRTFNIIDKPNNNKNEINNDNNIQQSNNCNNNNIVKNDNSGPKGFKFIKKKPNVVQENNITSNNINNNTNNNTNNNSSNNNMDLLGFGEEQNKNEENNINLISDINPINTNTFPGDIFSIPQNQNKEFAPKMNNEINIEPIPNNPNDQKNIFDNIQDNPNITKSKKESGFSFIKKKNVHPNTNTNPNPPNPIPAPNTNNILDDLFSTNTNQPKQNIQNAPDNNNQNKTSKEPSMNIFESGQLVDLFNIETPTSDAVLNLSKNLLNIYSQKDEPQPIINDPNPNLVMKNANNSDYKILNMNYPNININNYYNEMQNKNKNGILNNNYNMNPMMGYNYPPQSNYMNNNFGYWYGYGMNNQYMNIPMNIPRVNPIYNYNVEYNKEPIEIKEEPKPIILNNDKINKDIGFNLDLNLKSNKDKEDPFKSLLDLK